MRRRHAADENDLDSELAVVTKRHTRGNPSTVVPMLQLHTPRRPSTGGKRASRSPPATGSAETTAAPALSSTTALTTKQQQQLQQQQQQQQQRKKKRSQKAATVPVLPWLDLLSVDVLTVIQEALSPDQVILLRNSGAPGCCPHLLDMPIMLKLASWRRRLSAASVLKFLSRGPRGTNLHSIVGGARFDTCNDTQLSQLVELRDNQLHRSAFVELDLRGCCGVTSAGLSKCLKRLLSLTSLNLSDCSQLTDIAAVSRLNNLQTLVLRGCGGDLDVGGWNTGVSTLEPLRVLTQLRVLDLGCCKNIQSIGSLRGCTSLQELDLSECEVVTDLEPLSALPRLTRLNLARCCAIRSLAPLRKMKNLGYLNCYGCNELDEVEPLSGCRSLVDLNLAACRYVSNLVPLSKCKNLESLDIHYTNVTDVSPLAHCPKLNWLCARGQLNLIGLDKVRHIKNRILNSAGQF